MMQNGIQIICDLCKTCNFVLCRKELDILGWVTFSIGQDDWAYEKCICPLCSEKISKVVASANNK